MIRPSILRSLLACVLVSLAFVSDDPLGDVIGAYKKYLEELPQEKIYVHFNQPYYASGETIWFKSYIVAGPYHQPSPLSRALYVELLTAENKLIQQVRLYAENGSAPGNFLIPDTLSSGNYMVRAYTQWMRNFDEGYFFHRQIRILNPESVKAQLPSEPRIDVQFFPEGGEWIAGFKNKIAFKAIAQDGLGRKISGKILDESDNIMSVFESNGLGMGVCSFVTQKDRHYRALLDGSGQEIKLPDPVVSGLSMSVTNLSDQNTLTVRIQNSTAQKTVYLFAQARGIICYASKVTLPNTVSFVKIPKKDLPTGIIPISLLDENGNPRAERLVFIDNHSPLKIEVHPDKEIYGPREKITLSIQVSTTPQASVESDLSLAVCDDSQVWYNKDRESIYSYLYFSSELKGFIESPGYYFNPEHPDRDEALDILLMTQGWRRFIYKKDSSAFATPRFGVEQGLTIKGRLVDKYNGKPIVDGKVSYLRTFPTADARTVRTNAGGYFAITDLVYYDSAKALLQGETKKGSKYVKFVMDSIPEFPMLENSFPSVAQVNQAENDFMTGQVQRMKIEEAFNADKNTILLDIVEVKAKKETPEPNATRRMYGPASATVNVGDDPVLSNLQHPLMLLQGRVAGVQVSGSGNDWTVTIRGISSLNLSTTPLILLNSMVIDFNTLSSINVRDIESVDVYKGPDASIFGSRGSAGAIVFHTKSGVGVPYIRRNAPYNFNKAGFQAARQFYLPLYEVQNPDHAKPDWRTTLFWAPSIKTDSTGRATVTFYNHDLETTVTGIIEGISALGIPGSSAFHYAVKK